MLRVDGWVLRVKPETGKFCCVELGNRSDLSGAFFLK